MSSALNSLSAPASLPPETAVPSHALLAAPHHQHGSKEGLSALEEHLIEHAYIYGTRSEVTHLRICLTYGFTNDYLLKYEIKILFFLFCLKMCI